MAPQLRTSEGATIALEVGRWRAAPDAAELSLLGRLADPVLDIGCGPARVPAALAAAGRMALGIDTAAAAVEAAARLGAPVLQRCVFGPLPGEGRWATALLLDGNIGIGGDPVALLLRCHDLLGPGGAVVAEVAPPGAVTAPLTVRVEVGEEAGPWFAWAVVGADAWPGLATAAGLRPDGIEVVAGRWFAQARRP